MSTSRYRTRSRTGSSWLDTASGELEYVNAGHPFPFVWRAAAPATDLADALVTLALSHRQADDVTLLVIRRNNRA